MYMYIYIYICTFTHAKNSSTGRTREGTCPWRGATCVKSVVEPSGVVDVRLLCMVPNFARSFPSDVGHVTSSK